jgi:hypothetical protein
VIDSILVLVFSKKFRNFKRIAESLDIFHEDLIRREIVIDVIFGSELTYQEKERDNNEDHLQDFSHGFLHPRELAGCPYAGRIIREAWVKIYSGSRHPSEFAFGYTRAGDTGVFRRTSTGRSRAMLDSDH